VSDLFTLSRGESPLLVNVPHAGTHIPLDIRERLTGSALALPDTDWHVDRLYGFVRALGAGLMAASQSRYVIDLNRPPDDSALYNTRTTGLVPLETFDGEPVYREGLAPDTLEIERRVDGYWMPYHAALAQELERLRERHGHAVLLDAHSIRSTVPALFPGELPVFNLGSNSGASATAPLVDAARRVLGGDGRWDLVVDARFKGGYITRHYGQPSHGVHALQLEMAQRAYMDENTNQVNEAQMGPVQGLLQELVGTLGEWQPTR
jgi:N-formylglutamate deformylase